MQQHSYSICNMQHSQLLDKKFLITKVVDNIIKLTLVTVKSYRVQDSQNFLRSP